MVWFFQHFFRPINSFTKLHITLNATGKWKTIRCICFVWPGPTAYLNIARRPFHVLCNRDRHNLHPVPTLDRVNKASRPHSSSPLTIASSWFLANETRTAHTSMERRTASRLSSPAAVDKAATSGLVGAQRTGVTGHERKATSMARSVPSRRYHACRLGDCRR
jgi:hypothetical protein